MCESAFFRHFFFLRHCSSIVQYLRWLFSLSLSLFYSVVWLLIANVCLTRKMVGKTLSFTQYQNCTSKQAKLLLGWSKIKAMCHVPFIIQTSAQNREMFRRKLKIKCNYVFVVVGREMVLVPINQDELMIDPLNQNHRANLHEKLYVTETSTENSFFFEPSHSFFAIWKMST